MKSYIFDSCALIAFFRNENGAEKVKNILLEAASFNSQIIMHNASLAEIYYDAIYNTSKSDADMLMQTISSYPIKMIDKIEMDLIKEIGYFKTTYKVSFADCFVLATARLNNSIVVTSDHHEFNVIEKSGDVLFEWIR